MTALAALAVFALALAYEPFLLATKNGQTLGKQVMKIRVVKTGGRPLDAGTAIARSVIPMLASACTCGLGGLSFDLSPLFDSSPWRRGWRDNVASTLVVRGS